MDGAMNTGLTLGTAFVITGSVLVGAFYLFQGLSRDRCFLRRPVSRTGERRRTVRSSSCRDGTTFCPQCTTSTKEPFIWRQFHAGGGAILKQREEHQRTTGKKVWLVTGAGRGMGVDIANAALAAGDAVVATGRDTKAVAKAVGKSNDLLVVKLDVT